MRKAALLMSVNTAIHLFCHIMKAVLVRFLFAVIVVAWLSAREQASAQSQATEPPKDGRKSAAASNKPLPSDPEERFKMLFTNATLSGRWARIKDGVLGEE